MSDKPIVNRTHILECPNGENIPLAFVQSSKVKAFPCGRRRSKAATNADSIPFDPEARLNTEANNVSHSSLNGYTQTYLKDFDSEKGILTLVLGGYLFKLDLCNISDFSKDKIVYFGNVIYELLAEVLEKNNKDERISWGADSKLYANIRLEKVPLTQGNLMYYTKVLRNQSDSEFAEPYLDELDSDSTSPGYSTNSENYYFSGLSFSATPITQISGTRSINTRVKEFQGSTVEQFEISLCILNTYLDHGQYYWQINQEALLPNIEHGELKDSVKLNTLIADKIYLKNETSNELESVPSIILEELETDTKYRMCFSSVDIKKLSS